VVKYLVHRNLVDFGIFAQTIASAFGCFCNPIEGSHWAFHFSPILYPVGLVVALVHSPITLVVLQAAAGALVAPPIYALVRARSDPGRARLAALVAWLYPPLAGLIFGDFHENGFAPAAVAWTLYAFDAGVLVWAFVGALVVLSVKEDQALFLAVAGVLGAWQYRGTARGGVAAAVAFISVIVFAVFFAFIRPHAAAIDGAWQPSRFYSWSAIEPSAIIGALAERAGFLLLILVPVVFLPLRSKWIWLAVAPLAEVLLSRMPTTFALGTHYAGAWIGYLLIAFAFAAGELPGRRARSLLLACIAFCVLEFAVADPLHPGLNLRPPQARDGVLDRALQALPRDASIATQEEAYTHLALTDPYARLLPESPERSEQACLVLVDADFPDSPRLREYGPAFLRLVAMHQYVPVAEEHGITLYRRLTACR
jgi:uncharacterized membrane protein